ncbi:hypothetical protein [Crocosphaera sp.]|uniref:hypothetical protein n=1 Tax=Crocosphaera sp. TaxID=2729996 RepID=UPI003F1E658E|nr:hypothetical protein [Crocosphaera sp.]
MTLTESPSSPHQEQNHEIIYPQGEFWSDEPPLESNLHLIQSLEWLWQDRYEEKLRYFTPEGQLVPTPEETANEERKQKEYERQQKDVALQKIEQLEAKLRELGVDLEE